MKKSKEKKGKKNEKTNKKKTVTTDNQRLIYLIVVSYTLSLDMNKSTCQIPAKGQPILRKGDRFGLKNVTVYVGAPNFPILRKTSDLNQ